MADRFTGTSPDHYMKMPFQTKTKILQLLGAEGEVEALYAEADAEPGDDVFIAELEYDLGED